MRSEDLDDDDLPTRRLRRRRDDGNRRDLGAGRTKIHTVRGGGGLRLHVREWGKADGPPILFIHGWSQNHLCWAKQYESALADEFRLVAYDLRGHGMSEAPLEPEHYTDGNLWADDVAAIIDELRLDRPVLVGWSYGAFVICDYVRAYGQDRIAAIDFVEGAVKLGEAAFGTLIGPGFLDHFAGATADDLPTNIRAMRSFVRTCVVKPLPADDLETALCWNIAVPAHDPRPSRGPRDRLRRRAARARGAVARHAGPGRLGRAAGDGRAHPRHLPDRRGLLVRRCRSPAAPGGAALCAPTRAALLTGRNHHTVGMGVITELATSAPGYNSLRPDTCGSLPETLKLNGYSTAQFGKCHEVPVWENSPIGPFNHWPAGGNGFEYFYGFRPAKRASITRLCSKAPPRLNRPRLPKRATT